MAIGSLRGSAAAFLVLAAIVAKAAAAGDDAADADARCTLRGEVLRAFAPTEATVEIRRVATPETTHADGEWYRRLAASRALFATLADGPALRTMKADATGAFVAPDLPLGVYEVRAIAADGAWCVVAARAVSPGRIVDVTADLAPGRLTVSGRAVRRDGRPFRGLVAIDARDFDLRPWGGSAAVSWPGAVETGADGAFELRGVADGLHRLVAIVPGRFVARAARFFGADAPVFVVDEGAREIAGVVTDGAGGAPVAGAVVSCPGADDPSIAVLADARGAFRIAVPGGVREIAATAPSFLREVVPVPAADATTIALVRGAAISGRVTTADGDVVQGARVLAVPTAAGSEEHDRVARTGADGRFVFDALARGSWAVFVLGDAWVSPEAAEQDPYADWNPLAVFVEAGDRAEVERRAVPCPHVRGVAVAADGGPVAGASVESWPASGGLWSGVVERLPRVASRADGSFELPTLRGRAMTVWALVGKTSSALTGSRHSDQVTIAPSQGAAPPAVRLAFRPDAFLDLVVRTKDGTPVGGADLRVHRASGCLAAEYGTWRTHADGRARVGPLVLGSYSVGVTAEGFVETETSADVGGAPAEIVLVRGTPLAATIARPADAPRGETWVEVTQVGGDGEDRAIETVRAADDGRVRTRAVVSGAYRLAATLRAPDGRAWVGSAAVAAGDPPCRIELARSEPRRRTFALRVADGAGAGVARGRVHAAWREAGAWRYAAANLAAGVADVAVPADAGSVFVCADAMSGADGIVGVFGRAVAGPFAASEAGADVVVGAGLAISGVARRDDGTPLPGLTVAATPLSDPSAGAFGAPAAITRTRDDGSFTLRGLAAGPHRLDCEAPAGLTGDAPEVAAGADDVDLRVGLGVDAKVSVLDWRKEPLASATVVLRRADSADLLPVAATGTDARGAVRLVRLARGGAYALSVRPPRERGDLDEWTSTHWTPGDTTIVLPRRFEFAGRVTDDRGRGVDGVTVWARAAGGAFVSAITTRGGTFRIARLASADVDVAVTRQAAPSAAELQALTIGDEPARLAYEPGATIDVAVLSTVELNWNTAGGPGRAYVAELVRGEGPGGALVATQTVNEGETLVFDRLEAGAVYTLWLAADPRSWSPDAKMAYRAGLVAGAPQAAVTPAAGRTIEGRIVCPDGLPPGGVSVTLRNGAFRCTAEVTGDRYVARGLFGGRWTADAESAAGGRTLRASRTIEAGDEADLELRVR